MTEKFLLRVIEGHARDGDSCHLKADTVAKEMGCSVRTVYRAVTSCVEGGFLRFEGNRYKNDASEYGINWASVGRSLLSNPETAAVVEPTEAELLATALVVRADNLSDVEGRFTPDKLSRVEPFTDDNLSGVEAQVTPDNLSVTCANLSRTPDNLSTTPDTVSGVHTLYTRGPARTRSLNHDLNQRIKPCSEAANEIAATNEQRTGGWSRPITVGDLQNRDSVQRLWLHALKFKFVSPDLRVKFFALAKYTARMARAGEVQNAGAYFTAQVSGKNWLGDHQDVKAAVSAIALLDDSGRHTDV